MAVDIDGTLIFGDMARESVLAYARKSPVALVQVLAWLRKGGRLLMKEKVAERQQPDPTKLAWRQDVISFLRAEKERGRKIVIATAAMRPHAESVSEQLVLFDEIVCSTSSINLFGANKADGLDEKYGSGNWDYVGDSPEQDPPVFKRARISHMVRPSKEMSESAKQVGKVFGEQQQAKSGLRIALSVFRPSEWVINAILMLILPLPLLKGELADATAFPLALQAVVACCLASTCAAAVAAIFRLPDDMTDAVARQKQPLASGDITLGNALRTAAAGLTGFVLMLVSLPTQAIILLSAYILVAVVRGIWLARIAALDIIAGSATLVIRLAAGFAAAGSMQHPIVLVAAGVLFLMSESVMRRFRMRARQPKD